LDFVLGWTILNTITFADDKVIFLESENDLEIAIHQLQIIINIVVNWKFQQRRQKF
jgi:hypothetical protein